MEKVYFEDYQEGEVFVSPCRTITETDIVMFAAFTGDWHLLHTNVEYAAKTSYKERIAHGALGFSIGLSLPLRLGPYVMLPKSFIAFYGVENLRFIGPIKIGDTILTEIRVNSLIEKDNKRGILEYEGIVKNQRDEAVVSMVLRALVGRKPKV
ncbi:MAG: MaoC/PaaZ C-terminal domain-containing protein [Candidatus Paceibacterota bacterium]|jgi:acyl dehydratase